MELYMKKRLLIVLPFVSAMMFSGCATLFDSKQTISISSDSDKRMKAVLSYSDGSKSQFMTCRWTRTLKNKGKDLKIESNNNEFQPLVVEKEFNLVTLFDILGGLYLGPLSTTTDAVSGAMWEYDEAVIVHEK